MSSCPRARRLIGIAIVKAYDIRQSSTANDSNTRCSHEHTILAYLTSDREVYRWMAWSAQPGGRTELGDKD